MSFKKTAKREGLIFLGFLAFSIANFFALINFEAFGPAGESLVPVFFWLMVYSYPAFLIIRFLLWLRKGNRLR